MIETTLKLCGTALVAGMLLSAPVAMAGPSVASPEMQTALAKAAQGPDELRRYIHRTRMIYALNYAEVAGHYEAAKAAKAANATPATKTASAPDR
jgi:hypothetical protein